MTQRGRRYRKCLQIGCRSEKIIARGLCNPCYQKHVRQGTLGRFEATLKREVHDAHRCESHRPSGVCYSKCGCRCAGCKEQRRKERAKQIAAQFSSVPRWVDAGPCREHLVAQLAKEGVDLATAARQSGVSYHTLYNVMHYRVRRVKVSEAMTLMSWHGTGWCEHCGKGVRAYGPGRWCSSCLTKKTNEKRRGQHAA